MFWHQWNQFREFHKAEHLGGIAVYIIETIPESR